MSLPTADVLLWLGGILLLVGLAGWTTLAKARRLRYRARFRNRYRPNPLLALSMAEFNRKGRRP